MYGILVGDLRNSALFCVSRGGVGSDGFLIGRSVERDTSE